jgi:bifunctional NMN adenylyltransferase/nudix hydrolase
MFKPDFDFLVFIGRFQPFHAGHQAVVDTALQRAERVIVLVGSSCQPRTLRNPWTFSERETFIRATFPDAGEHLILAPLLDDTYNEQGWITRVQQTVHGITCRFPPKVGSAAPRIGLIGHSKDHSSYYLSMFPQWQSVAVENVRGVSSTPLREQYFQRGETNREMPPAVQTWLENFRESDTFQHIASEWEFVNQYRKGWEAAPYAPTFVTVDAVVVQAGHILLIERKARPGKGQWALPGGFLDPHEKLRDAVIRELREETRIKVPAPVLAGSIVKEQVFDDPYRSARGRTITHAFLIELKPDAHGLPKVKGGDDAQHAFWMPLGDLDPERLFEDHFQIIKTMIG